jgi:hypothetical protein
MDGWGGGRCNVEIEKTKMTGGGSKGVYKENGDDVAEDDWMVGKGREMRIWGS